MSLIQQISNDLLSIQSEGKRRSPEIKQATDKSLDILRSFNGSNQSEQQYLRSLSEKSEFIIPLLYCCRSRNTKLVTTALQCLYKLLLSNSLPVTKLDLIVDALQESTNLSIEIQLKVLQILPTFFQSYSAFIYDELLAKFLLVCSSLQAATKPTSVSNTASATLLQLINSVFEKVNEEDKSVVESSNSVPIDNDETISIATSAYDAQRIFLDLCTLIEHHKPSFLKTNYITEDFGFELLESVIKNNRLLFLNHRELGYLLRVRVAPILLRFLSSSKDFNIMVRVSRLIILAIKEQFTNLKLENEVTLSLITHILLRESASPYWKKVLCMEVYREILKDFDLIKIIFAEYDGNRTEERKPVLFEFLNASLLLIHESGSILNTGEIVQVPYAQDPVVPPNSTATPSTSSSSVSKRKLSTSGYPGEKQEEFKGMSMTNSYTKVCYIDSFDKTDPPPVLETYLPYLICQCVTIISEGIFALSLTLSSSISTSNSIVFLNESSFDESSELKQQYDLGISLVIKLWTPIFQIYEKFIFSGLDNELFSKIIRSLQKLCHASGILGIKTPRNEILTFFAKATLNLTGKSKFQTKNIISIGESIVGTISSTINQAVSTISTSGLSTHSQEIIFYPRNINSRNILCFRVLVSLAIALGGVLQEDWDVIFITLQWISYYIDGPTGLHTKEVPLLSPYINNNDLSSIDSSLRKLSEGVKNQSPEEFYFIFDACSKLSNLVLKIEVPNFGHSPIDIEGKLQPCAFNSEYFINKITDLCELNPLPFLIENDTNWNVMNAFFEKLSCDRELDDELRKTVTRSFNSICKRSSVVVYEDEYKSKYDDTTFNYISGKTEEKVLKSLNRFIINLSQLPKIEELLVQNCEAELLLQVLDTLKEIVNRFGNYIKVHWDIVFQMLHSPFLLIGKNTEGVSHKALYDIIVALLKSTFETLKVILDEILQSIPINQIRVVIDGLFNFVTQSYDLNISFNSISYFWLISDYLKGKIEQSENDIPSIEKLISSEDDLVKYVVHPKELNKFEDIYDCLWLYLIFKLAKLIRDDRAQVRNGTIMTFFSIIHSCSDLKVSWLLIYKITLNSVVMQLKPGNITSTSTEDQKNWEESLCHIIEGLGKLYETFLPNFGSDDNIKDESLVIFWSGLIEYYTDIIDPEMNWIYLNTKVFHTFENLLECFLSKDNQVKIKPPTEITESFLEFWSGVLIKYNLILVSQFQDFITSYLKCFIPLFVLTKSNIDYKKFEKMLMIFNTCIRYPLLSESQRDEIRCTDLQKTIIANLSHLKFTDPIYESLLIQQITSIILLPFSTRDLIEKKIGNKLSSRIPTFIAVSYDAIELLNKNLDDIEDLTPFLNDKCISKVYKALLEPAGNKTNNYSSPNKEPLWRECSEVLSKLAGRIVQNIRAHETDFAKSQSEVKELKSDVTVQIFPLLLQNLKASLVGNFDSDVSESFDIEKYNQIKLHIISIISLDSISDSTIEQFISIIWTSSFLYTLNEIENDILTSSSSPSEVSKKIASFNFDSIYGSTKPLEKLPRIKISKLCLNDLIEFSLPVIEPDSSMTMNEDDTSLLLSKKILSGKTLPYFVSRCAFIFQKFLNDCKLLHKQPLPKIQQLEIMTVLEGISKYLDILIVIDDKEKIKNSYNHLEVLYGMLIKCTLYNHKIKGISELLVSNCLKIESLRDV
ncbi:hypothetical protein B5S33_g1523 [[Candida] boidinii]|nr:hypothetical protein B5S33_g1523 [[Candida] boidinii]